MYEPNTYRITLAECEQSITRYAPHKDECVEMLARLYTALADQCYLRRDFVRARQYYKAGLQHQPFAVGTLTKYLLLQLGGIGVRFRDYASAIR
jgi:hypothetical protein